MNKYQKSMIIGIVLILLGLIWLGIAFYFSVGNFSAVPPQSTSLTDIDLAYVGWFFLATGVAFLVVTGIMRIFNIRPETVRANENTD
jgi:uncharacterized BrkB/YihY/UPF0761 family membrane protein